MSNRPSQFITIDAANGRFRTKRVDGPKTLYGDDEHVTPFDAFKQAIVLVTCDVRFVFRPMVLR